MRNLLPTRSGTRGIASAMLLAAGLAAGLPAGADEPRQGWEESGYIAARLLPLGSAVAASAAYGRLLWGDNRDGNPLYGYVRPSGLLSTSVLLNRGDLGVDVFPVAFLGFRGGVMGSQRAVTLDTLDCTAVNCGGFVGGAYVKGQALAGYGPVSGMASLKVSWLAASSSGYAEFGDDISNLAGLSTGDRLVSLEAALAYRISRAFSAGGYYSADHMLGTGATDDLISGFGKYTRGPYWLMVGAGGYESTTQARAFTSYLILGWSGWGTIGL